MRSGVLWGILAAQVALFSQIDRNPVPYPGQSPGPLGIPFPIPRGGKQGPAGGSRPGEATTRTSGKLQKIDEKTIVVEAPDGRVLEFRRSADTKFYKDSPGSVPRS